MIERAKDTSKLALPTPHTRRQLLLATLPAALLGACGVGGKARVVGFVTWSRTDLYSLAAVRGAQEAADELKLVLRPEGPPNGEANLQGQIVDDLVADRVDAIAISPVEPNALATSLLRARNQGIKVNAWDAETQRPSRGVFLRSSDQRAMGELIADLMMRSVGYSGDLLMVTQSLTDWNMAAWMAAIQKRVAERAPGLVIRQTLVGQRDPAKDTAQIVAYLRAHPTTKGIFTVDDASEANAAEAVMRLGIPPGQIAIIGIGAPNTIRPYVAKGVIKSSVMWNPIDLGYAAVYIAHGQMVGSLKRSNLAVRAGRLPDLKFHGADELLLGPPTIFDATNIGGLNF